MKKFFALFFVLLCFLLSLSACSSIQSVQNYNKEMKRIAFISPQTDYPVWLQAKVGFLSAAEDFGFYGMWLGGGNCNIEDMLREIDIAISENVDAVITCPLTPGKFTKIFEKLKEHEIPLVTIAVDAASEDLRTAYVGSNYEDIGRRQAEALHAQVGDDMTIGVIMSGLTTQNQVIQTAQLQELVETLPHADIVSYEEDWADPVVGMHVFSKMLNSHPDINAVFVTSGGAIGNYGKILQQKGLTDEVTLIGMDISQENLDAVAAGTIYGVMSQDYYSMGYLGGRYAFDASLGKTVPNVTYTESELITMDNLDSVTVVDVAEAS
ncbi:sugar ABC transporter substrate-binding protein [Christensenella tenuis]|uniref:Substrate-binding domain-containing protein n=1 Tax=Christensenella tenuis TaxID=2763033 RepID=A0ABR7EHD7_9FIRM|nr:substrate-binding domain-containing protein [Christensenella tenuis]MBC5649103.1 substrate-binding domain-containing protein [Christensenella tenuis]